MFDVVIVGGGPAGSTCAAFCAAAGLTTLLLEREKFPREKVCGDCVNPACWPILEKLDVVDRIRLSEHSALDAVEFIAIDGQRVKIDLPSGDGSEIAIKRSLLDDLLFTRAAELGAEVRDSVTVSAIEKNSNGIWQVTADENLFEARMLVAADGRNSTVARLCNLLPPPSRERIALQSHIPLPAGFGRRIVLQFLKPGYSGQAPVNEKELNLCLVAKPQDIDQLKNWATQEFSLSQNQTWRTITPLTRAPLSPAHDNLFLIGDAARVVEPFTGEGIYYALGSGQLAANAIIKIIHGNDRRAVAHEFARDHAAMYRGRLWINRLARAAVLSPHIASRLVRIARFQPSILRVLTGKIVQSDNRS